MNLLVVVVILYPLILVGVSLYRSKAVKSHADFMVAGRSVPVLNHASARKRYRQTPINSSSS